MPLVVEGGSGNPNADSYVSLAFADAYHASRGNVWDGTVAEREAWLRKATSYIDGKYRNQFPGQKASKEQALYFPVVNGFDADGYEIEENEIPLALMHAVCEAALVASQGTLGEAIDRGGMIKRERVEGAVDIEYMEGASGETIYPKIDHLLGSLIQTRRQQVFPLRMGG